MSKLRQVFPFGVEGRLGRQEICSSRHHLVLRGAHTLF